MSQLWHPVPYDHLLRTSWKRHSLKSSPLYSPKATFWPVLKWLEIMFFLQISFFRTSVYFIFLKFSGLVSLESQHSWSPPPVPTCLNWDGALSCFLRALAKSLGICLLFISRDFSKHTCLDFLCQKKKKASFHDMSTELFSFTKVSYIGALPMIGEIRLHSPLKSSSILLHFQLCIKTRLTNGKQGVEK